jgi:hypothetical protein
MRQYIYKNITTGVIIYNTYKVVVSTYQLPYTVEPLDLSFFKGMEKTNDECGKTINPGNYFF